MTTANTPPFAGAGSALTVRQQRVQALERGETADLEYVAGDIVAALSVIQAHAEDLRAHDLSTPMSEELLDTLALSIQALAEVAQRGARAIQVHAARTLA